MAVWSAALAWTGLTVPWKLLSRRSGRVLGLYFRAVIPKPDPSSEVPGATETTDSGFRPGCLFRTKSPFLLTSPSASFLWLLPSPPPPCSPQTLLTQVASCPPPSPGPFSLLYRTTQLPLCPYPHSQSFRPALRTPTPTDDHVGGRGTASPVSASPPPQQQQLLQSKLVFCSSLLPPVTFVMHLPWAAFWGNGVMSAVL